VEVIMRTLFFVLAVLALAGTTALAQVNPPLPSNIVTMGQISMLGDDGSLVFGAATVNGKIRLPAGVIAWSAAPFRYAATFYSTGTDTVASLLSPVPVDTMFADVRGDIAYPVQLVLPGAIGLSADVGDTLWARAYYTN
jgi:hypothetical protein